MKNLPPRRLILCGFLLGTFLSSQGCNLQNTRDADPEPTLHQSTATDSAAAAHVSAEARSDSLEIAAGIVVAGLAATSGDDTPQTDGPGSGDLWTRIRQGFALPDANHRRLEREAAWFENNQAYLDRVAERARPYLHHIVEEIERRDMPLELALLPIVESGYQPFAYSPGRAAGIWQFIPGTGRRFGLKQNWWYDGRRDITASTRAALDYLQALHAEFQGDWLHAIAAYNCGEGNVQRAIRRNRRAGKPTDFWHLNLPRETKSYVPRLLSVARVVANPEAHGLRLPPIPDTPYLAEVDVGSQIDLALAADLAQVPLDEFYRLNPGFNRWATDPAGPYGLQVPVSQRAVLLDGLASLPPEKRVRWERHRIRSGESLGLIARRYRTTIAVLRQVNGIRGSRIRAGRDLMVPVAAKSVGQYTLTADARRRTAQNRPRRGAKTTYVVRHGDSLWTIAQRYGVSTGQLARWNSMAQRDILRPGQKLAIWHKPGLHKVSTGPLADSPAVTGETRRRIRYTVRPGESLWQISRRFNVSVASLRKWNGIKKGRYLQPGQTLSVYVDVTRQAESI